MQRRNIRIWLSLGLAAFQSVAAFADDTQANSAQAKPAASQASAAPIAGSDPAAQEARKSRLRFRTADGTCGCTCASGGTSEVEIQKATEVRERAGR